MKAKKAQIQSLVVSLCLAMGSFVTSAWADPAVPAGSLPVTSGGPQQPGGIMAFLPFIMMFAVIYFLVLRPQKKRMKEQQDMLSGLKSGDEVVTTSGLLGKVAGITDKVLTLEIADNVKVKMMKSQVSQIVKGSIKDLAQ